MKAKQQAAEAEKAAKDPGNAEVDACLDAQEPQGLVSDEGPAKSLGERNALLCHMSVLGWAKGLTTFKYL